MRKPPPTIDDSDVIAWSPIDSRHLATGNIRHHVGGELLGVPAGLAICRYPDDAGFYLFRCDADWNVLTDTLHDTQMDAKAQAEFEYQGLEATWQAVA